jgi:hypothetical protein
MQCSCCKYSRDECFEYVLEKRGFLKLLNHYPREILFEIAKFVIHFDFHSVMHTVKTRAKPSFMNYDEDGEYYYVKTKPVCTWCFQLSIVQCLELNKHLPRMRFEITYFMNTKREWIGEEIYKDEINNMFTNYYLPKTYVVDFYRQSQPKQLENNKFIILPNKE